MQGFDITSGDVQVTKVLMILCSFMKSTEGSKQDGDGPTLEYIYYLLLRDCEILKPSSVNLTVLKNHTEPLSK